MASEPLLLGPRRLNLSLPLLGRGTDSVEGRGECGRGECGGEHGGKGLRERWERLCVVRVEELRG